MKRTTKPDRYSATVRHFYLAMRAGRLSPAMFSMIVQAVWDLRRV